MITKDGRDTQIENLTPDNYIVPKGEEKFYHVVLEIENYDRKTGKKLSKAYVQKFGKKIFDTHVHASLKRQGYKITILHDPTAWANQQREKAAAVAKAEAEKAKFDAAVDAAVAKATAELEQKYAERDKEIGRLLQELEQRKEAEAEAERKAEQEALLAAKAEAEQAQESGDEPKKAGRPKKDINQ